LTPASRNVTSRRKDEGSARRWTGRWPATRHEGILKKQHDRGWPPPRSLLACC
jgi:hypothetical protein